jgi:transcriptional regulator with XRE-family HTH domain
MLSRKRGAVPVEELREAARQRSAETSQRQTAREIGVSKTGLRGFLEGRQPYGPTLEKLRTWYASRLAATDEVAQLRARVRELEAEVERLRGELGREA